MGQTVSKEFPLTVCPCQKFMLYLFGKDSYILSVSHASMDKEICPPYCKRWKRHFRISFCLNIGIILTLLNLKANCEAMDLCYDGPAQGEYVAITSHFVFLCYSNASTFIAIFKKKIAAFVSSIIPIQY